MDELERMYYKSDIDHLLTQHNSALYHLLKEHFDKLEHRITQLGEQVNKTSKKSSGIPWKIAIPLGVGLTYLSYVHGYSTGRREEKQRKTASEKNEVEKLRKLLDKTVKEKNEYAKALKTLLATKVNEASKWAFLAGVGTVGGLGVGFAGGYYLGKKENSHVPKELAQYPGV